MFIVNKKNIIKSMALTSLSLSFTLAACFSGEGGLIYKEDMGFRSAVNKDALPEDVQEFMEINIDSVTVLKDTPPEDASNNADETEPIPSGCADEDINKSVISGSGTDSKVHIYLGGSSGQKALDITSCGVRRLKNKIERSTNNESLIDEVAKHTSGAPLKVFYDENQDMIQIELREIDGETSFSTSFVLRDKLKMSVEDDVYTINIDSRLEKSVQAHLLAHALVIIEIETDESKREFVEIKTKYSPSFSSIQQLYYSGNPSNLAVNFKLDTDNRNAGQIIAAFYLYSRFYAYSINQALKEEGLAFDDNLDDERIKDEIEMQLTSSHTGLTLDDEEDLMYIVPTEDFYTFIDIAATKARSL